jgi:hypothetical protein
MHLTIYAEPSAPVAHAKGILAFEYDPNAPYANYGGGFHLTHSIPGFPVGLKSYVTGGVQWLKPVPAAADPNFEWLSTGRQNGQTLFCYNLSMCFHFVSLVAAT